jgi:sirohydrochlorin cobaltochelatase
MKQRIAASLEAWLARGGSLIGQILIRGKYELLHAEDVLRDDLEVYTGAEAAREIAVFDDRDEFRPLRTAPTLRRGWKLELADAEEVRLALDYFYPAMAGTWFAFQREEVQPYPLQETLGRQSGMYAVAEKVSDNEAHGLVERVCGGCLKRRLWDVTGIASAKLDADPREMPMLCAEACNLFVAAARNVVKKRAS